MKLPFLLPLLLTACLPSVAQNQDPDMHNIR